MEFINKIHFLKRLSLIIFIGLCFVACTKSIPYKSITKNKVYSKSIIDVNSEYLYIPSTGSVSKDSGGPSIPYFLTGQKIVKLKFTEKSLRVYEIPVDPSLRANENNFRMVLEIPVDHLDYRCAMDRVGQCKNEEEENTDITWNSKTKFRPDFSKANIAEINLMPESYVKYFQATTCMTEVGTRLSDFSMDENQISFQFEKSYNQNPECIGANKKLFTNASGNALSNLSSTVVTKYSLVKLNSIASKDYTPKKYSSSDQNKFGFFKTTIQMQDVDAFERTNGETIFLNRWNPNKKAITYFLSSAFNKPENTSLKNAAIQVFSNLNESLRRTGLPIQFELRESKSSDNFDVRSNFILLAENFMTKSYAAYSPIITNPKTGEILSGRIVFHADALKALVRQSYKKFVFDLEYRKKEVLILKIDKERMSQQNEIFMQTDKNLRSHQISNRKNAYTLPSLLSKLHNAEDVSSSTLQNSYISFDSYLANHNACLFAGDIGASNKKIDDLFVNAVKATTGSDVKLDVKNWEQLTEQEMQSLLVQVEPEIFSKLLIHEIGHNLGLRHNFAGSFEKNSSVMDYSKAISTSLSTLGEYDLAALKFAYNDLATELGVQSSGVKKYLYCTDENLNSTPYCHSGDAGETFTESARSLIEKYQLLHSIEASRGQARNFNIYQDINYARKVNELFYQLRSYQEFYEKIKYENQLSDQDIAISNNTELQDLRSSALVVGNFFLDILETPDVTCVVNGTHIPLAQIDSKATSCFEIKEATAQAGEFFLDTKFRGNQNADLIQIDRRGYWLDKILAARYLFSRKLNFEVSDFVQGFEQYTDNFYDHPELQDRIRKFIFYSMIDNLTTNQVAQIKTGQYEITNIFQQSARSNIIPRHADDNLVKFLQIPDRDTHLSEILGQIIVKQAQEVHESNPRARELLNLVGIYKTPAVGGATQSNERSTTLNGITWGYEKSSANLVAAELVSQVQAYEVYEKIISEIPEANARKDLILKIEMKKKLNNTTKNQSIDKLSKQEEILMRVTERQYGLIRDWINGDTAIDLQQIEYLFKHLPVLNQ